MQILVAAVRKSLVAKLVLTAGVSLVASISALSFLAIVHQEDILMGYVVAEAERLGNTIKLGTRYAMMLNSRDDINQIITNIGQQEGIEAVRIYNKEGRIKFSNLKNEVETQTNIRAEACHVCHHSAVPTVNAPLEERIRIFTAQDGSRRLGIISPIHNEDGCSGDCHFHPEDKRVLGAIDVVLNLDASDREIAAFKTRVIGFTLIVLAALSGVIALFMLQFVIRPIRKLISGTKQIAKGEPHVTFDIMQDDEIGQLAQAVSRMGDEISEKQQELNKQRDEYYHLFSNVPCTITVQDKNFRLLRYNKEFREKFKPKPGDFCYRAYKGRSEKCPNCPVEQTLATGRSYCSEESGLDAEGIQRHWLVTTAPVCNKEGEVVAAMEMSLDITSRKQLEVDLEKSERKYLAIFQNIPNPVFVLDAGSLTILDCNESVKLVYGYERSELVGRPFVELFREEEREAYARRIVQEEVHDRAINVARDGRRLFVTIRVSPSEFSGQKVLLVTTSDITKRLETEQQLIQASKMATLGEMATGVAHELNQPLSVIKTASGFIVRKITKGEELARSILLDMASEIDSHVDRAAKIINHLREFGRKPEMKLEPVALNGVIERAFDIFSQQLKLREIEVMKSLDSGLPLVMADAGRLEQVFINMLLNARDAIEDKCYGPGASPTASSSSYGPCAKRITVTTRLNGTMVEAVVEDTGIGIKKGVIEKIFEPFFTTKRVGKGTGLGLSISYGIVKDCGGDIKADSTEGVGTRFTIMFPALGGADKDGGQSS